MALGSDRWPLASLAVVAGGFGRVQPALLCHGPAAAVSAEGDRGPELAAQTLPRRRPRVLDFSCQRRWALAHSSASKAAQGPGCWWTQLKAPHNKVHQSRAARILCDFHMDKCNQEIKGSKGLSSRIISLLEQKHHQTEIWAPDTFFPGTSRPKHLPSPRSPGASCWCAQVHTQARTKHHLLYARRPLGSVISKMLHLMKLITRSLAPL